MNGHAYALLAATMIALSILVNKTGLAIVPPLAFGAWRSLFIVIGLSGLLLVMKRGEKIIIKQEDLGYILLSGIISALAVIAVFYGQSLTTAVNTGFLLRLNPLFILLLAPSWVGEKRTRQHLACLLIMLAGTYLILTDGQITLVWGDLLIILTALLNSLSDLLCRKALFRLGTLTAAWLQNAISMVLLLSALFSTAPLIPAPDQLVWIILSGGILVIFWTTFFKAMKLLGATTTSLYTYLSPLLVAIGAYALLGESMTLMQAVGGLCILAGAYLIPRMREPSKGH